MSSDEIGNPLPRIQKQSVDSTITESIVNQQYKIKQDMAKKLSAFDRIAKKAAQNIAQSAGTDSQLREALYTRQVDKQIPILSEQMSVPTMTQQSVPGMQIGNFAVFSIPNVNGKTRFTVANQTTGQELITGLHLAEGANAIVKLLNRNHSFHSPQIRQILDLEDNYKKHYGDAISFMRKVKNNPTRDAILETRFEESKIKASQAKQQLLEFTKKL